MASEIKLKPCPTCGRQFQRLGRFGKFCSVKCRYAFYNARHERRARTRKESKK